MDLKVYRIILVLGLVISIFAALINSTLHLGVFATCLPLINGGLLLLVWIWAYKTNRLETGKIIILVFYTFLFMPTLWVLSAGTYGSIITLLITDVVIVTLLLKGISRIVILLGGFILFNSLIIFEMYHPDFVIAYSSAFVRYLDYAISFSISFIISICIILLLLKNIEAKNIQLLEAHKKLQEVYVKVEELSIIDPLTSIYNRRFLMDKLNEAVEASKENEQPLGIVLLDLDHFKKANDTYGHGFGDEVLKITVATIQKCLRQSDILGRYGGEEFLIILPLTEQSIIFEIAERIGAAIRTLTWRYPINVTISGGIAMYQPYYSLDAFLEKADRNLYVAKETGRDRIVTDSR